MFPGGAHRHTDQVTASPSRRLRPTWHHLAFHAVGAVALAVTAAMALVSIGLLGFFSSTCGDEPIGRQLARLRTGTVLIAMAAGAVPLAVAGVARWRGFAWMPWAALAGAIVLVGLVRAVTTADVGRWCLY
jgi:hypothetical protein